MGFLVYNISNKINGKKYVGITTKSLEERMYLHISQAGKNSKKNMLIAKAILKYGKDNFSISLLEECDSKEEMLEREKFWISDLDTYKSGYNMTLGGEGLFGFKHSEETKSKMSERMMGNNYNKGHFKGRNHSEETKKKISLKNSGENNGMKKGHTKEAREKISKSQYKKVAQYKNGKLIRIFDSFQEAARAVSGKPQGISRCCRGIRKNHRGYAWKYVGD